MKHWSPEFSPFNATVDSIVSCVRIPFLPLHYRDEDILRDLVSILDTPIQVDEESLIGRAGMFRDEENDPGWIVIANGKGKAKMSVGDERTFKEAAKGIRIMEIDASSAATAEVGKTMGNGEPSGKEKARVPQSKLSPETKGDKLTTFKSPKNRIREKQVESEANLEVLRVFGPLTNIITP
ncbi:hypothetical protein ACE6H2_020774 [Prunus campanulata]